MAADKKAEQKSAQSLFLRMYAEVLGLSADSISTALQDIIKRVMTHRQVMRSILETLEPDEQEAAWVLLGDYLPARPSEPINVEGLILDDAATDVFRVEELDVDDLNNQQEQNNTMNDQEPVEESTPTTEPVTEPVAEPVAEPITEACEGEDPPQVNDVAPAQDADNDIPVEAQAADTVTQDAPAQDAPAQDAVSVTQDAPKKRGGPRGPRAPKIVVDGDAYDGVLVAFTLDGVRVTAKSLRTVIMSLFRKCADENKLDGVRASWYKQVAEPVTDERLYKKLEGTDLKVFINLAVPDCKKRVQALLNILKCDITLHFADGDRTVSGVSE